MTCGKKFPALIKTPMIKVSSEEQRKQNKWIGNHRFTFKTDHMKAIYKRNNITALNVYA